MRILNGDKKKKKDNVLVKALKAKLQVAIIGIGIAIFITLMTVFLISGFITLIGKILGVVNTDTIVESTEEVFGKLSENGGNFKGGSGSIAEAAKKLHAYMVENQYYYYTDTQYGPGDLPSTNEALATTKATCCATFVYWVCLDAGYISQDTSPIHNVATLEPELRRLGFTEVNIKDRQDGDILVYGTHHIDIAASDASNTWKYNAGSTAAIRADSPPGKGPVDESAVTEVLRAPAK